MKILFFIKKSPYIAIFVFSDLIGFSTNHVLKKVLELIKNELEFKYVLIALNSYSVSECDTVFAKETNINYTVIAIIFYYCF